VGNVSVKRSGFVLVVAGFSLAFRNNWESLVKLGEAWGMFVKLGVAW
jgi:hypothetical protein